MKHLYSFRKSTMIQDLDKMLSEKWHFFKEWLTLKGIKPENSIDEYSQMLYVIMESELEDEQNANILFKMRFNDILKMNEAIDHLYGISVLISALKACTVKNETAVIDYSHLITYTPPFFNALIAEKDEEPHCVTDY